MKIQCQNCGVEHQIDPPSWVVSSGRAFRFRCSSCGYSQSVQPAALNRAEPVDTPAPAPTPREVPSPRQAGPTITPWEDEPQAPDPPPPPPQRVAHLGPSGPTEAARGSAVFLKQNGQIYMVSDWDTLRRWIAESRVDRHDLVSEGGVRWDPIGSRPDLLSAFAGLDAVPAPAEATPFPFGGETPFGGDEHTHGGWHDDDTEGIPTGLPPLPTDEVQLTGFDAATARPRHLTPTPAPVARKLPPPVRATPAAPSRAVVPPPQNLDEPVPPALPDTVPPPPLRATPFVPRVTNFASGPELDAPLGPADDVPIQWAIGEDTPTEQGPPRRAMNEVSGEYPRYPTLTDEQPAPPRSRWPLWLALAFTVCALGVLVGAIGVSALQRANGPGPLDPKVPRPTFAAEPPSPPAPAPMPMPMPVPVPVPTQAPPPTPAQTQTQTPDPTQTQTPDPDPTPAPEPTAAPRPAAPRPSGAGPLVRRAWDTVERDPGAARALFADALRLEPGHVDANYGYGYALLSDGSPSEARPHLCVALTGGDTDTRREVRGLLDSHGLTCP